MIGKTYRFTPKYTPNNVQEAISTPFKELAADMRAQDAANAKARQQALQKRNQQYNKLYGVAGKGFEGWSKQHIDEYENQFQQSLNNVMNAPNQAAANQMLANELLRLERVHAAGEGHARLRTGQNSAHDQYVGWNQGSLPWRIDGETPITSDADLARRENNWENSTVNVRTENVGGYDVSVGDYMSPRGRLYKEEVEEMFQSNGIEYTEEVGGDGITYIRPVNAELGKPVAVSGPMMLHPGLGNRLYFTPESVSNTVTYTEFAGNRDFQTAIGELQKLYKSDVNRISFEEANSRARAAATALFNSSPVFQSSAIKYYEETYGDQYRPEDFVPDPDPEARGMSPAASQGRKTPKQLYLDGVMSIVGFDKQVSQSGSGTRKLRWQDIDKANKTGIPDNITYEDTQSYKLNTYSSEDRAIIESLNNEPRIDLTVPEEINLQFSGEKVNTIRMYPDAGYMLIERVNADTEGKPMQGFTNNPDEDGPDLYDRGVNGLWEFGGWEKQPEPKYFVIPIIGSDGEYSDPFKQIEQNIVSEYIRTGDLGEDAIPLRNIYKGGI